MAPPNQTQVNLSEPVIELLNGLMTALMGEDKHLDEVVIDGRKIVFRELTAEDVQVVRQADEIKVILPS